MGLEHINLLSNLCLTILFASTPSTSIHIWGSLSFIGAGLAAIGCIGSGIGQGYVGGKAVEAIGRNPEVEGKVRTQYIISAAIAESGAIYALVIGIICLFVVSGIGK